MSKRLSKRNSEDNIDQQEKLEKIEPQIKRRFSIINKRKSLNKIEKTPRKKVQTL